MKIYSFLFIIIIILSFNTGCTSKNPKSKKAEAENKIDTSTVADTGFTGIRKYFIKNRLVKEITFKNGIRQGLLKTYQLNGNIYQSFWYENGKREDTAKWYYEDGRLFRKTPYFRDSMNGIQIQYFKNGRVKAKMSYKNGIRTPYLEEFNNDGKKVTLYPDVVIKTQDDYKVNGTYKLYLELSDKSTKVTYYRGEFTDSLYTPNKYKKINIINGKGTLVLRKTGTDKSNYIGVIAEILTGFGNKYPVYKKVNLPYNDLN